MNPTQDIQLQVARKLGWTDLAWKLMDPLILYGVPQGVNPDENGWNQERAVPKFSESRDACWEGWEKDAPEAYWDRLQSFVCPGGPNYTLAKATPLERCKTFLACYDDF